MPVVFLLLFVYVFGGQLGAGLGHEHLAGHGSRATYLNFVVPGILLMTVAAAANGTAILVAMDMTGGIVARFRTMSIARASVLAGHVLGSVIQALLGVAVVTGIALALGFRPTGSPLDWLAGLAILILFANALAWLATALGLAANSVETASNTPMFLTLLPFLSSGFVLIASLPIGLRQFAQYQPFTPVTDSVRGLLFGGASVASDILPALAWSLGITLASYLWARRLYDRRSVK
jgi:ABC-2 type transport system permease protein